ncbi:MAG: DUF2797 domain-containing protein [Clostridiaceae bacterium]|nr:DUF2797 domain-containing protein [Clostridiaceae bacterium]
MFSQCKECQSSSGFDLCLGCTGDNCRTISDKAKKFCNEEHHVYLAYFANDKLKVGTAASYRRYERLLEQGALYSIFLAKVPSGKLARKIESEISKLGITTRVNSSYKISNFVITRNQDEINNILMNEYENILRKMDEKYKKFFIRPEYNNFTRISDAVKNSLIEENRQLNLFGEMEQPESKEYSKVVKPESVRGNIRAVVGSLMLIEKDKEYSVINMKNLEGYVVNFDRKLEELDKDECFDKGGR